VPWFTKQCVFIFPCSGQLVKPCLLSRDRHGCVRYWRPQVSCDEGEPEQALRHPGPGAGGSSQNPPRTLTLMDADLLGVVRALPRTLGRSVAGRAAGVLSHGGGGGGQREHDYGDAVRREGGTGGPAVATPTTAVVVAVCHNMPPFLGRPQPQWASCEPCPPSARSLAAATEGRQGGGGSGTPETMIYTVARAMAEASAVPAQWVKVGYSIGGTPMDRTAGCSQIFVWGKAFANLALAGTSGTLTQHWRGPCIGATASSRSDCVPEQSCSG
jgi:hypothetical protein